jgi:RecA/RadA recombinase
MPHSSVLAALSLADQAGPDGSLARASELLAGSAPAWPLGWPELDAALPGGVPRGQITEWAGPRSAGKTAALRQMVGAVRGAGAGAAYVDGTGTLAPAAWVFGRRGPGGAAPFWVVRPPEPLGVLAAAEELCRSGAFGLVIAEGADWSRTPVIRLQRLAREMGAALIAVVERPGSVPLAGFRVQFASDPQARSCRIQVRGHLTHEVPYAHDLPYRLPEDSGLPDRRGAAGD